MKKITFLFILILFSIASIGQNLQLHYDFTDANSKNAEDRDYMTATFEMFKPDKAGSTFWFIDLDFNGPHHEPNLAYLEISRDLKLWEFPLAIHGEYNGGFMYHRMNYGAHFSNILILGPSAAFELGNVSLGTYAGYRYDDYSREGIDFQWTGTWFSIIWEERITLTGFIDIWSQDDDYDGKGKKAVIITEPQIWYNFNKTFALGGEVEVSHNFIFGSKKIEVFPTIGAKVEF
ncbi:MAG: DUF5020 domain-containing protein [Salinivirgaceae bacterium]|nr:MAG: DUF5020 domain-containing protein [Salinivirgaceae bacterium]